MVIKQKDNFAFKARIELGRATLNNDIVEEIYKKRFDNWVYYHSSKVSSGGDEIPQGLLRFLMTLPDENGNPNMKGEVKAELFDKKETPLDELIFIEETILKYKSFIEELRGIPEYRTEVYNLRFIINYMEQRERELSKPTQTTKTKGFDSDLNAEQIKEIYNQMQGVYFETTLENFEKIFKNEPLIDFTPIKSKSKFTNTLVANFIYLLFQSKNPNNFWAIGEHCFEKKNLRQSFNNAYKSKGEMPKNFNELETIIKNILSSN